MNTLDHFFALALLLATASALPAAADSCSCTYSGSDSCEASIICETGTSSCSCTANGCSAACRKIDESVPDWRLGSFNTTYSNIHALGDWLANLDPEGQAWTATAFTTTPEPRITIAWTDTTFLSLVNDWAAAFGACAKIDWVARTIEFRRDGGCGQRPGLTPR